MQNILEQVCHTNGKNIQNWCRQSNLYKKYQIIKQTDDRRGTDVLSTGNKQDGGWNDEEVQSGQGGHHEHLPVLSQGGIFVWF